MSEPQWISVADRLPEPDHRGLAVAVLVARDSGVGIGYYGDRWHFGIGQPQDEPSHWMPLPKHPVH